MRHLSVLGEGAGAETLGQSTSSDPSWQWTRPSHTSVCEIQFRRSLQRNWAEKKKKNTCFDSTFLCQQKNPKISEQTNHHKDIWSHSSHQIHQGSLSVHHTVGLDWCRQKTEDTGMKDCCREAWWELGSRLWQGEGLPSRGCSQLCLEVINTTLPCNSLILKYLNFFYNFLIDNLKMFNNFIYIGGFKDQKSLL